MSISVIEALLGCVAAVAGTGVLAFRLARAPRAVVVPWAVAGLGLAVCLGAQVLGFHRGFGPTTFRAMEVGGQVVAPLALCLGLAEVVARSAVVRFAARLTLPALALVVVVILATDPLNTTAPFSTAWPAAAVHYEFIPNKLLEYGLAPVTVVVALIALGFTVARSRREPAWREAAVPVAAAALAALALAVPPLSVLLKAALPLGSAFVLLCLVAAVLLLIGALRIGVPPLEFLHGSYADQGQQEWADTHWGEAGWAEEYWEGPSQSGAGPDAAGHLEPLSAPGFGYGGEDAPRPGGYAVEGMEPRPGGHPGRAGYDHGYGGEVSQDAGHDTAGYGDDTAVYSRDPRPGQNGEISRADAADTAGAGGEESAPEPVAERRDSLAGRAERPVQLTAVGPDPREARERLFGQIAIYTLVAERVGDFDRLAEQVVAKVKAGEPDTLVYILHAVPSAPLQRILYEVYRDRAAFEDHQRRPYVTRFESDSDPFVLATNMIELGLQQAKVSPFPAIASLFAEPGGEQPGTERPERPAGQSDRLQADPEAPGSRRPL
jgi:quinol monooxygenase YgiN